MVLRYCERVVAPPARGEFFEERMLLLLISGVHSCESHHWLEMERENGDLNASGDEPPRGHFMVLLHFVLGNPIRFFINSFNWEEMKVIGSGVFGSAAIKPLKFGNVEKLRNWTAPPDDVIICWFIFSSFHFTLTTNGVVWFNVSSELRNKTVNARHENFIPPAKRYLDHFGVP